MKNATEEISAHSMIPDLLRRHPAARRVLDKYGLKGCGGAEGPYESLRFFARAHDVDEHMLVCEIEQSLLNEPNSTPELQTRPDVSDTIYRRFFAGAILLTFTLGATWGAYLLWKIGLGNSYSVVSINDINSHGQAQIYGWMGLFIMGFAYQAFPRFWHTSLCRPMLAVASFWMMLTGIITSAIGLSAGRQSALGLWLGFPGSLLETIAVILFAGLILATFKKSKKSMEPYIGYIFVALSWFIIASTYNNWHVWNTLNAASDAQFAWLIYTFQPALRDLQFYGLGLTIVAGVSLRTLPHFYDLPKVSSSLSWLVLCLISVSVAAVTILDVISRYTHSDLLVTLMLIPWSILLAASFILISNWRLWKKFPEPDRSAKFVKAGYSWLVLSLVMLLCQPFYNAFVHPFSTHAYMAATHHAITVGFISMMIMGHAAKVVPTLNGIDPRKLSSLWLPFILINVGCLLRVSTQVLTDVTRLAYPVIGFSGSMEVLALAIWGCHLLGIMLRGKVAEQNNSLVSVQSTIIAYPVNGESLVADVLNTFPTSVQVFITHGFTAVTNPVLRNTLARQVTIAKACKMNSVDLDNFLNELNAAINPSAVRRT